MRRARLWKLAAISIGCMAAVSLFPAPEKKAKDFSVIQTVRAEEESRFSEEEEAPGTTCQELVESYLEWDSRPVLMDTTGYCYGEICYTGCKPREGIVAACPSWIGHACVIYEAVPVGDEYEVGNLVGIYEVLDIGYGRSTGDGIRSKIRDDKSSRGTIEVGQCIDKYCTTKEKVTEWMELTGGKIFVQIIAAEG